MDADAYFRLFEEKVKELGFYGAWEAVQPVRDPEYGPLLVKAVQFCSVPTKVDFKLAFRLLRSRTLGLYERVSSERIFGGLLSSCFVHRSMDHNFFVAQDARKFFDRQLRQTDAYAEANRIAAAFFHEKRLDLPKNSPGYAFTVKDLRCREVFHRLVFDGERAMRALRCLVKGMIRESTKSWQPTYGDIKTAPSGALWYALNVCQDRREFIPAKYQSYVDNFRDQFLAIGGEFAPITVGSIQ